MISKGGMNEFHGSGYIFKRHEQLNASNFFNNRDGLPLPIGRYTSYRATVGGPIKSRSGAPDGIDPSVIVQITLMPL